MLIAVGSVSYIDHFRHVNRDSVKRSVLDMIRSVFFYSRLVNNSHQYFFTDGISVLGIFIYFQRLHIPGIEQAMSKF